VEAVRWRRRWWRWRAWLAAAVAPTWKLAMPTCSAISTAEIALNFSPVGISR